MRPHINSFFKACAELLPCPEPNVEVGAYQVAGQETIADLRPHFPGKTYIGCDMRLGRGVDRIEDIHALSFQDGDAIFAQALMQFPIHSYPEDYWWFIPAVPFDNWLGPLLALPSFVVETTRPLRWQESKKLLRFLTMIVMTPSWTASATSAHRIWVNHRPAALPINRHGNLQSSLLDDE